MSDVCASLLMTVVLPLWIVAGLADWWCHRRTGIERTSGLRENMFHLTLFAIASVGAILIAVFLVNLLVLVLLLGVLLLHEGLTWVELRFVWNRRVITPLEQMVHSFMEVLPLLVLAVLTLDHLVVPQTSKEWTLQVRDDFAVYPLALAAAAVILFNVLPLLEETLRCARAGQSTGRESRAVD